MRSSKFIIISIAFVCARLQALAWHEYQPFVVENRVWDCGLYSYTIQGDTVINDALFKKALRFVSNETNAELVYVGAVKEENRMVDMVFPDTMTPVRLYDFTVGVLNKDWMEVLSAANVLISGQERRQVEWSTGDITGFFFMIEGIGFNTKPFDYPWHFPAELDKCYDGEEVIYDRQTDDITLQENPYSMIVTDGEVNGDSQVDIADVNAVIDMMLEKPLAPSWDDVAADMDLNGTIDIADVNAIINAMLGKR